MGFAASKEELTGPKSLNSQAMRILLHDIDLANAEGCDRWDDAENRPETMKNLIERHGLSRCPSQVVGGEILRHTNTTLSAAVSRLMSRHAASGYKGSLNELYAFGSSAVKEDHLRNIGYDGAAIVSAVIDSPLELND